ncbi:hypothetical protein FOZ62_029390 [Perkinsus olseni]|uniref:Reverse transcriptase domain-containing protein n=1 Tax=Perkinsus olseni TaxID=32597 RepID=A0A7J6TYE3_PEROL|nr:hypothetical protein FOZ62_029390 [Perkinsus olseni]
MDDMVIVAQDHEEVEATRDAAIQALEQHGFRINQAKRAHNLDTYDYAIGVPRQPNLDDENLRKASWLNYRWFISPDVDVFDVKLPEMVMVRPVTLSQLKSVVARLYDPLGILAEITLELRYLMRTVHDKGYETAKSNPKGELLDEDDSTFAESTISWCDIFLHDPRVLAPRYVDLRALYCFCDASEFGIAWDICISDGIRVAAWVITQAGGTIPRRELESARLVMLTLREIIAAAQGLVHRCVILSDSSIALYRMKTILANPHSKKIAALPKPEVRRLNHIYDIVQGLVEAEPSLDLTFRHVRSAYNVADALTRPRAMRDLSRSEPSWAEVVEEINKESILCFTANLADGFRREDAMAVDEDVDVLLSDDDYSPDHFSGEVNTTESAKFYQIDPDTGLLLSHLWKSDNWIPLIPFEAVDLQREAIDYVHRLFKHSGVKAMKDLVEQFCTFKNIYREVKSNLFIGPFTVTAIEGVTISICDKEGQTSACGIHQLKRGGPKIKIAREGVDIVKKAASVQTETELAKPAFDESDLRQWRDAVMNEGVMTRSKKRALEKMDGVINTNDNKEPKVRRR